MKSVTYQKVFDENETSRETKSGKIVSGVVGWVYEVREDGQYVDNFPTLRAVKAAYPNATKRSDHE